MRRSISSSTATSANLRAKSAPEASTSSTSLEAEHARRGRRRRVEDRVAAVVVGEPQRRVREHGVHERLGRDDRVQEVVDDRAPARPARSRPPGATARTSPSRGTPAAAAAPGSRRTSPTAASGPGRAGRAARPQAVGPRAGASGRCSGARTRRRRRGAARAAATGLKRMNASYGRREQLRLDRRAPAAPGSPGRRAARASPTRASSAQRRQRRIAASCEPWPHSIGVGGITQRVDRRRARSGGVVVDRDDAAAQPRDEPAHQLGVRVGQHQVGDHWPTSLAARDRCCCTTAIATRAARSGRSRISRG